MVRKLPPQDQEQEEGCNLWTWIVKLRRLAWMKRWHKPDSLGPLNQGLRKDQEDGLRPKQLNETGSNT